MASLDSVAQAAARILAGLGRPLIGVSWGRTMSAVAHRLPPFWNEGVEVVLLNGAMNIRSPSTRTNNVAELSPAPPTARPRSCPCRPSSAMPHTRGAGAGPDHREVLDLGRRRR